MIIYSWDKTRMLAAELLLLLPKPLPGYDTPTTITSLWNWGCKLVGSAKQRESDSGNYIYIYIIFDYINDIKINLFL